MILKISFANSVHQHAMLVKAIKTHVPNVWAGRIEFYRDNNAFVCLLTMNLVA